MSPLRNSNSTVEGAEEEGPSWCVHIAKHIVKQHYTNGPGLSSFHITMVVATVLHLHPQFTMTHNSAAVQSTKLAHLRGFLPNE